MRVTQSNPLLGAAAGAVGGLAGAWAMVCFNRALGGGGFRPGDSHPERRSRAQPNDTDATFSDEPATMQAASAIAEPVLRRELGEHEQKVGGSVVHFLFSAALGAIYGATAETRPGATRASGIPFGTAVWVAADEIGMPLAGFASHPRNYPLSRHAAAFGSHIVFGLTVESVRRLLRGNPALRLR
jgi:hypothetical protein